MVGRVGVSNVINLVNDSGNVSDIAVSIHPGNIVQQNIGNGLVGSVKCNPRYFNTLSTIEGILNIVYVIVCSRPHLRR